MKIHKTHTKGIILSVLIGAAALIAITPALSYWTVSNQSSFNTTNNISNSDFDVDFSTESSDTYHTVTFYRTVLGAGSIQSGSAVEYSVSGSSTWTQFLNHISEYGIYIDKTNSAYYTEETVTGLTNYTKYTYKRGTYNSNDVLIGSDGQSVSRAVLEITTDVVYTDYMIRSDLYSGAYTLTVNTMSEGNQTTEEQYFGTMKVKNGEIITSKMFSTFFESMQEDYYFSSLIYTNADFNSYFYLNETPVTSDLSLYVLFYEHSPSSMGVSTLTDMIISNSGTLKVYDSEDATYNITGDATYRSETNSVNVGYYDKETLISSGSTVNLCMSDGNVYETIDYSSTQTFVANENDSSKACDYTVRLTGDLVIEGTLTIGADIGAGGNQGMQSQIYSHYVCLDLCGHNIYINNGGELDCYGVIKDSIGNGEIHVYGGGIIQSTIVCYDYKAGGSTIGSYNFDVFPFSAYNLIYLQVPTFIEYDSNGWGEYNAFYVLNPFGSVYTELDGVLKIVGSSDDCLLSASSGTIDQSYVLINLLDNPSVANETYSNSNQTTTTMCLYRHLNLYFYDCTVTVKYFTISFSVTLLGSFDMNSNQFDFPISPMFSLYFYNSDLILSSRINFQKGSSLYMDEDSNLILTHSTITRNYIYNEYFMDSTSSESIDVAGSIMFFDVSTDTYFDGATSMYTKDRHTYNSVSNCENYLYNNTAFYKYASSSFKIAGNILLTEGNSESTPYSICGNVDCASIGIVDSGGTIKSTHDFHTTDSNNYNPFNSLLLDISGSSLDVYFKTYDFDGINGQFYYNSGSTLAGYDPDECCDYMVLQRGRSLPLISNGVAYAFNNIYSDQDDLYSPNLVGTFNTNLSLIDSNGYFYYFNTDGEVPYLTSSSSSSSHRNYEYNHNTKIVQCNYDDTNHKISDASNASNIHVFFCSGYYPYSEDNGSSYVTLTRLLSKYNQSGKDITSPLKITYNDSYGWITAS